MQNYQHPTNPDDIPVRLTQSFRQIGSALIAVAALLSVALPATAETAEARPAASQKADALLSGVIETNDPGLAVLVAQNGKILFEKCYGLADREHHVPVIPQTTFRIGSITKQFTASAILKLQEQGKLSVTDKLSKYIPDFPRGDEVTLRHLLTHTSGIHSYTDEADFESRVSDATTTEAIIAEIKKFPYDFNPGANYQYNNSGYTLLGFIVEKVSGQSYGDFLRENFFQPVGMTNTAVYRAHPGPPHEALGYSLNTNGFERALNWDMSWAAGAGALYSTVEDLYRWNEGLFNRRVLGAASLKAAFTDFTMSQVNSHKRGFFRHLFSAETSHDYGFGWIVTRYRGAREISHGGNLDGFCSMLLRMPDEKLTVAILANAEPGKPDASAQHLAHQLVDIFLAKKHGPLPIINTNVSPKSYDALTGRYELQGKILTISRRGPNVFGLWGDQPEEEIFPKSDTEFFSKLGGQITFVKDSSGKVVKIIAHGGGLDMVAPRVHDT